MMAEAYGGKYTSEWNLSRRIEWEGEKGETVGRERKDRGQRGRRKSNMNRFTSVTSKDEKFHGST